MPQLDGHEQLLDYFWDVGPALPGPAPLTHTEIYHWQENTGNELSPWEASTLRRLSIEYVAQCEAARAVGCPSPAAMTGSNLTRDEVASKIQQQFSALMAPRKE